MGYRNTAGRFRTHRNAPRNAVLAAAALLLTVLSGCGDATEGDAAPSSFSARAWPNYTTADGALSFEYPPSWQVTELAALANDPAGGVSLQVADGSGRVLARLDTGIIADLSCTTAAEPGAYAEYEAVPMPELGSAQGTEQRFVYRSLAPAGERAAQATYAVVSGRQQAGQCGLFDFFTLTASSGGRFAGEYLPGADTGDARAYLEGAERYRESDEYRDIKRMLTSLRNAH